jgi:hypothetical protein
MTENGRGCRLIRQKLRSIADVGTLVWLPVACHEAIVHNAQGCLPIVADFPESPRLLDNTYHFIAVLAQSFLNRLLNVVGKVEN